MSPVWIPNSFAVFQVDLDGINILRRAECLASPLHASELFLGEVAGVHIGSFPCPEEVLGLDRLEVVKSSLDVVAREVLASDKLLIVLFWGARCGWSFISALIS
jgi:hypothetical protein